MSHRDPSEPKKPEPSNVRALVGAIALASWVAMGTGCSTDPASALAPHAISALNAKDSAFDLDGDGRLSAIEKALKKAADDSVHNAQRLSQQDFDKLKKDWEKYKKDVESGTVDALTLRCEPFKNQVETRRIGPKGGEIKIGEHVLTIPAGALAADVEISMSQKAGPAVDIDFEPHGLRFAKPVEMSLSYKSCIVPDAAPLGVVYVENGWKILQTMPSTDKRASSSISALTDHFSGYVVAWGRE